jgi:hypothetical protein
VALTTMVYGGVFVTTSYPASAPQTIFVLNTVAFILNMKAIQDYRFRKDIQAGRFWATKKEGESNYADFSS